MLLTVSALVALSATPGEVARGVAAQIVSHGDHFFPADHYGSALLFQGFFECEAAIFDHTSADDDAAVAGFLPVLGARLDAIAAQDGTGAYDVLHNRSVRDFGMAIGDTKGLMPLAYLERAAFYSSAAASGASGSSWKYSNATDVTIAAGGARAFILAWPQHLDDANSSSSSGSGISNGTIARRYGGALGWGLEPRYLWCDDMYMGLALLARLATLQPAAAEWQGALRWAAAQLLQLSGYLAGGRDGAEGLFAHGYDSKGGAAGAGAQSCCAWGRANGWVLMAHVALLEAFDAVRGADARAIDRPLMAALLSRFRSHAAAMAAVQEPTDGRWHQVLDANSTFLETSATAMATFALATGLRRGWLDGASFRGCVDLAWLGLSRAISDDGKVEGICSGCGIKNDVAGYDTCGTAFLTSGNGGLGAVLRAAAAMQLLLEQRATKAVL